MRTLQAVRLCSLRTLHACFVNGIRCVCTNLQHYNAKGTGRPKGFERSFSRGVGYLAGRPRPAGRSACQLRQARRERWCVTHPTHTEHTPVCDHDPWTRAVFSPSASRHDVPCVSPCVSSCSSSCHLTFSGVSVARLCAFCSWEIFLPDPTAWPAGKAPAQWTFDRNDWWLEEHGLIMEKPDFPITPGKYLVTGGRETTAVLTIGEDGGWTLANADTKAGAPAVTLHDVTHLPCRSARYVCLPSHGGSFRESARVCVHAVLTPFSSHSSVH